MHDAAEVSDLARDTAASHGELTRSCTADEIFRATGEYASRNIIGSGNFGIVYQGVLRRDREIEIAAKVYKRVYPDSNSAEEAEVRALKRLPAHRRIAEYIGCTRVPRPVPYSYTDAKCGTRLEGTIPAGAFVVVYKKLGTRTLESYLREKPDDESQRGVLTWPQRVQVLIHIAEGLAHLAEHDMIHRDLRSANVIVEPDGGDRCSAVIVDFGLAFCTAPDARSVRVDSFPIGCTDPEFFITGQYTPTSDVFGFGVIVLEMLTGLVGFAPKREQRSLVNTLSANVGKASAGDVADKRPEAGVCPPQVLNFLFALAQACVALHGSDRPSAQHVLDSMRRLEGFARGEECGDRETQEYFKKHAKLYRKKVPVLAFKSKEAPTFGANKGREGDWVVMAIASDDNPREPADIYPVGDETFAKLYQAIPGERHLYKKVQKIWAAKMKGSFDVMTYHGNSSGREGDWLCQSCAELEDNKLPENTLDQYVIKAEQFERLYEPASESGLAGQRSLS
eukprot:tig00021179_g19276.t1